MHKAGAQAWEIPRSTPEHTGAHDGFVEDTRGPTVAREAEHGITTYPWRISVPYGAQGILRIKLVPTAIWGVAAINAQSLEVTCVTLMRFEKWDRGPLIGDIRARNYGNVAL